MLYDELSFRWNHRKVKDDERMDDAIRNSQEGCIENQFLESITAAIFNALVGWNHRSFEYHCAFFITCVIWTCCLPHCHDKPIFHGAYFFLYSLIEY